MPSGAATAGTGSAAPLTARSRDAASTAALPALQDVRAPAFGAGGFPLERPSIAQPREIRVSLASEPLGGSRLPVPAAPAPAGRNGHHDMLSIRRVIQEYASAFGRLDPGAAKRVWPSLDEQALARAFRGLQAQSLTFDDCGVTLTDALAQASCHGRATYLPKVGRRRPLSTTGEWTFSLARNGSAWVIQSAAVQ